MITAWRDIGVFLDGSPVGERIAARAAEIARRHSAHLIGVYGAVHPRTTDPADAYARGSAAISRTLERHQRASEEKILSAGRAFAEVIRTTGVSSEYRVAWRDGVDDDTALRTLHCDLAVCARPKPMDLPEGWTAEHVLLVCGGPVLLVPDDWSDQAIGDHVVIAWNGSREARRAVADAMPLLAQAARVTIVAIDRADGRSDPGETLIDHLGRHGVAASVHAVARADAPTSEVLAREAVDLGADCLVIGAYSRPRAAEILFGSTTRNLLANCPVPLFLSR